MAVEKRPAQTSKMRTGGNRSASSAGGKSPPRAAKTPPRAAKAPPRPAPLGPAAIRQVFERLKAHNPEPQTELEFVNPYTLLVAVVLSAQATDVGVNKATRELFRRASSPTAMVALGEAGLRDMIKTIGLYRNKAKNVIALSQRLIEQFDAEIPRRQEDLESLPGVGRKTANVVMNAAFGAPTIAVDTHVFRVANRLPLVKAKTPLDVERGLERVVPGEFKRHAHHWLVLHGRYVCKARRPECQRCVIEDLCRFPDKSFRTAKP